MVNQDEKRADIYSFGVTYEGLKPVQAVSILAQRRGFGVTYEGLKLSDGRVHYSGCEGFGVTYEGLKHVDVDLVDFEPLKFWSYL